MDINLNSIDNGSPNEDDVTASTADRPLRRSLRLSQKYENANMMKMQAIKEEPMEIVSSFMTKASKSIQTNRSRQTMEAKSEDLLSDDEYTNTPLCLHQDPINNEMIMEHVENDNIYRGLCRSPSLDLSKAEELNLNKHTPTGSIKENISHMDVQAAASKSTTSASLMIMETRNVITQTNLARANSEKGERSRHKKVTPPKKSVRSERKTVFTKQKRENTKGSRHPMKTRLSTNRTIRKNYRQSFKKKECCDRNHCNYQERLRNFTVAFNKGKPRCTRWVPLFQPSILPDRYPPHFTCQLSPVTIPRPSGQHHVQKHRTPLRTPDNCSSTSSSPSLPNSLRGVFHTDDMHELLNIDRVSYRLYDSHVQALAIVLNMDNDSLCDILDKIINIPSNVLDKIDSVLKSQFVKDDGGDLFPQNTPPSTSSGVITSSPGLNSQRHFPSQRKN